MGAFIVVNDLRYRWTQAPLIAHMDSLDHICLHVSSQVILRCPLLAGFILHGWTRAAEKDDGSDIRTSHFISWKEDRVMQFCDLKMPTVTLKFHLKNVQKSVTSRDGRKNGWCQNSISSHEMLKEYRCWGEVWHVKQPASKRAPAALHFVWTAAPTAPGPAYTGGLWGCVI